MCSTTTGIPPAVLEEEMRSLMVDPIDHFVYTFLALPVSMSIETIRYNDMGLVDPIGIVGFPSVGLVSSITANYYVSQLKMKAIAGMSGPGLPPYCLLTDNVAYPPIRVYGRKSTTKTGRDAIVCTSEYAPKPDDCYEVAVSIADCLRDLGCKDIICLEGIPRVTETDLPVICGNGPGCERMIKASDVQRMENGMVKGISGIMMYDGNMHGMNVVTMLCPANPAMPDPGSAMAFLEPISKMVKGLKVNAKELMAEAEEIRKRIEADQEAAEKDPSESAIYG